MTELERELNELGGWIEFPEAPDVLPALTRRLARRRRQQTSLAVALAAAAAVGAVFAASPNARSSVLRWIGIQGELERVPNLPTTPPLSQVEAGGRLVSLHAARRGVDFTLSLPKLEGLGPPDRVYLDGGVADGLVTYVWGRRGSPRLLLSEWRGNTKVHFHKLVQFAARTEKVRVDGDPGIWVSGPPHVVFFRDADGLFAETPMRLAGNVLLWMSGALSYRVEADTSLDDALVIAESLRPND